MSTGAVEAGFLAFLTAALGAETITAGEGEDAIEFLGFEAGGVTVGLRSFTGGAAIPELLPACVIQCDSNKSLGGRSSTLRRAVLKFHFLTPRKVEGYSSEIHKAIQAAVMAEISAANEEALSDALEAAGAGVAQGWGDSDDQDANSDGWFVTVHTISPFGLRLAV